MKNAMMNVIENGGAVKVNDVLTLANNGNKTTVTIKAENACAATFEICSKEFYGVKKEIAENADKYFNALTREQKAQYVDDDLADLLD